VNSIITTGYCSGCHTKSVIIALRTAEDRSDAVSGSCPMCGATSWREETSCAIGSREEFVRELAELIMHEPCSACGANLLVNTREDLVLELNGEEFARIPMCSSCLRSKPQTTLMAAVLESLGSELRSDGRILYDGHTVAEVEIALRAALARPG